VGKLPAKGKGHRDFTTSRLVSFDQPDSFSSGHSHGSNFTAASHEDIFMTRAKLAQPWWAWLFGVQMLPAISFIQSTHLIHHKHGG
jgi:hypothetical protein